MTESEQISAFESDLERLIQRYRDEFELSNAAAIGVLELQKYKLCRNCIQEAEEDRE
jgi:hypothetical protein